MLALADRLEAAVDAARAKGGKPELVAHRVESAVRRILTTAREREAARREHEERRRRRRRAEHSWTFGPKGELLELQVRMGKEPEG